MGTRKKLRNIAVSYTVGQVGITFLYEEDQPAEHFLLPLEVAEQLTVKLHEGCKLAKAQQNRPTGDDVRVSDHVGMQILPPKH